MKAEIRAQIAELIQRNQYFLPEDFSVTEDRMKQVTIMYDYDNQFVFKFKTPNSKSPRTYEDFDRRADKSIKKVKHVYVFQGSMKPGKYAESEEFEAEEFDELSSQIRIWLSALENELVNAPLKRRLQSQESVIKDIKDKVEHICSENASNKSLNDYFSHEEGEALKSRLDELEKLLSEKIMADFEEGYERDSEIKSINQEIERMKSSSEILNKKNWFKQFAVNVFTWSTDPIKQKRLSYGIRLIENVGRAIGMDMPKISGLLPIESEAEKTS